MTRRRAIDWTLIVLLTASWGVLSVRAIGEGLRTQRGKLWMYVVSAESADSYPLDGEGDEVVSVAGQSLRGSSALRAYDLATREASKRGFTELTLRRDGALSTKQLRFVPMAFWWLTLMYSAGLVAVGLVLVVRAPEWHLARRTFAQMWLFALPPATFSVYGYAGLAFDATLGYAAYGLACTLCVWNLQEFTPSARPLPAWQRSFALATGAFWAATYAAAYLVPASWPTINSLLFAAVACLATASIGGLARAYFRAGALERRQIRWVVLGYYVAMVGGLVATVLGIVHARAGDQNAFGSRVIQALTGLAPSLGIVAAVLGYRWLDIDRLISAAASYTLVGVALLGGVLALVPCAASAAAALLGVEAVVTQWLLTMALILAAVPAYLHLRPWIDRRLFADRHRCVTGLAQLVDDVGRCAGAEELWTLTSDRIFELLEPESLVVYARAGERFTPRFSRAGGSAAPYAADSLLVRAIERRALPLAADASELDPFDRATLETLGVALVIPFGTHDRLLGFACLGRKGSRDIYTREEKAQLAAVALRCAQVLSPRSEAEPAPALLNVLRREGDLWTLASNGKEVRLRDMRGLHYLAMLLREPGREFSAVDLVTAASGLAPLGAARDPELRVTRGTGDAGPVLDARARAAYRERLTALDAELADAERSADLGRRERASEEREILLAELDAAGRGKRASSDSGRARVAVTKAIKAALERIAERHPELGAHLAATVRRGYACAYEPDPRDAAHWEV